MLAWSEELDNGRQKTEIMVMTSLWKWESYLPITPITWQTCHAVPKIQINRRRTLPASFRWWDAHCKQFTWKTLSESQDAVALQQIKERGALPMIDRRYPSGNRPLRRNIWASLPGAGYGCRAQGWQPDCKIQRSGRNGQRDWCMSRVTAIISALVICIIVCLSWAVNHYRGATLLPTKPSATKMPENWSWRTRHYWLRRCVTDVAACLRKIRRS